jgi:tRNA threonylcarbamoyladenosine biosynthesis protein TsaE
MKTASLPDRAMLTEEALIAWGADLGRCALDHRVFVALYGPLGSGKTTLVRAACRGVGVVEDVLSPTFTLVNQYASPEGAIYHADLYRLSQPEQLVDIGWDDLLMVTAPVFVEWAERAGAWLPTDRWDIRLAMGEDAGTRSVVAAAAGGAPAVPSPEGS